MSRKSVVSTLNLFFSGPDLRKFLDAYAAILDALRIVFIAEHGIDKALAFHTKYSSILRELAVVCRLTRHVGQLSDTQLDDLERACAAYGKAFRTAHNGRPLTVKGHLIEKHVIHFARWYGTCGCFGEDGLEAMHPLTTAARIITRCMRNPEARHRATDSRLTLGRIVGSKRLRSGK